MDASGTVSRCKPGRADEDPRDWKKDGREDNGSGKVKWSTPYIINDVIIYEADTLGSGGERYQVRQYPGEKTWSGWVISGFMDYVQDGHCVHTDVCELVADGLTLEDAKKVMENKI
jgi:hypothetical protein